jgi:transcriptional regulator with XRE-family HTH domain
MTFLELLRRAQGLHQWQLAMKVGLEQSSISYIETSGVKKLSRHVGTKLTNYFGEFWTLERLAQEIPEETLKAFVEKHHDRLSKPSRTPSG